MPEQIIPSQWPLRDAINRVTNNGAYRWELRGWTGVGLSNNPIKISDAISHDYATSGLKGTVFHPNGTSKNFTIRHDYDYGGGSVQSGGKGYHVNVELPDAKYAFVKSGANGERYAVDCIHMLSERRLHDGDEDAARWFMSECCFGPEPDW